MRLLGTMLVVLGVFLLASATLAYLGPQARAHGVLLFASVTSLGGTLIAGLLCVAVGAYLRQRGPRGG